VGFKSFVSVCITERAEDPSPVSVTGPCRAAVAGLGGSHRPGGKAWPAGPGHLPRPDGNAREQKPSQQPVFCSF